MRRLIEVLAVGVTDDSGLPVENGTVTFYDAGTSNLRTVYQDFAETSTLAHANPATLDAAGRLIAYSSYRVKLVIRTSAGATVRTIDNVGTADSDLSSASASTFAGSGLTAPGDGSLAVNVDGTTLEVSSDIVRVKDAGLSKSKLDATTTSSPNEISNLTVVCSVATNALTIAFKTLGAADPSSTDPITVAFRNTTATSGSYTRVQATAAITPLVISSGSTLGHVSAVEWPIYVYACYDGTNIVPLASTSPRDERYVVSSTAEGGAGAADSAATAYTTTAVTSKAIRLVAVLKSTQTTAGTWAVVPTNASLSTGVSVLAQAPIRPSSTTVGVGGVAVSASSGAAQTFTSSSYADVSNLSVTITTSGRPVVLMVIDDGNLTNFSYMRFADGGATVNTVSFAFVRDSTQLTETYFGAVDAGGIIQLNLPPLLTHIDFPASGTYTYKLQVKKVGSVDQFLLSYMKLVAYEI